MERPRGNFPGLGEIFTMDARGVLGEGIDDLKFTPKNSRRKQRPCYVIVQKGVVKEVSDLKRRHETLFWDTRQVLLERDFPALTKKVERTKVTMGWDLSGQTSLMLVTACVRSPV